MVKAILLLFIGCFLLADAWSQENQVSDFIVVKNKKGRTVKSFFPGLYISFITTNNREVDGLITTIRNDSVFVKEWDVRTGMSGLGIPVTDTLGSYLNGYHYKEIAKVDVSDKMQLQQAKPGNILIIGGVGYILLNVINGAYLHEPMTDSKNLTSLAIAGAAIITGFLLNYFVKHGNKLHVEYIHMNPEQKHLRAF